MINRRFRGSLLGVIVAGAVGIGVVLGFWLPDDDLFEIRKNFRIFGAVYENVVTGYVEPVNPGHLMRVGVEAMLDELDPYTAFIGESETVRLEIITEGRYGGVGLEMGRRGGRITVVAPVGGASAYRQGMRTGDVLTKVAGQSTADLSIEDVRTLLRGEPGTTVDVTVERQGVAAPLSFTLTREKVELPDVGYRGRVGEGKQFAYVKLERFTRDAAQEVETALDELRRGGALEGVVLDLRDNPGGLLRAAVGVTALFVSQGSVVVSTRGREDNGGSTFRSRHAPLLPEVPLVVLVNGQSASASEIVAGAIQDHDRGVVLGTTTYGKGLVQNVKSLPHNTNLKLTTGQYYTPSGRTIQEIQAGAADSASTGTGRSHRTAHGRRVRDGDGIRPDVHVAPPTPSALEAALSRRAAFFRYANQYAAIHDTLATNFAVSDSELDAFRHWLAEHDVQYPTELERAVDSLRAQLETNEYESVRDEAKDLDEALAQAKSAAFDRHASALKQHLEREILARFLDARRQVATLLPSDTYVTEATELLATPERYRRLLAPSEGE